MQQVAKPNHKHSLHVIIPTVAREIILPGKSTQTLAFKGLMATLAAPLKLETMTSDWSA